MDDSGPQRNGGFPILPGELGVRFGCGFVMGLVVGFFAAARYGGDLGWLKLLAWMVGTAVVFGLLAWAFGNEFWRDSGWWA